MPLYAFTQVSNSILQVTVTCKMCRKTVMFSVRREEWEKFKTGIFVQDAFPFLTLGQREMLISQICEECWDTLWPKENTP